MPAARKSYTCDLCGGKIGKGDVYHRVRVTPWMNPDYGGWYTYRVHESCNLICQTVMDACGWEPPSLPCDDWNEWLEAYAALGSREVAR